MRCDDELDGLVNTMRKQLSDNGSTMRLDAAFEGMELEI